MNLNIIIVGIIYRMYKVEKENHNNIKNNLYIV